MFGLPFGIEGEFWCIREDLAASRDLVVPKPLRRDAANIADMRFTERKGIIILGFYYEIFGNDVGFILQSIDDTVVDGATQTLTIIAPKTPAIANSRVCENVPFCIIPLSPAEAAPTPANGATLRLTLSGVPTGRILIWGVHGTVANYFPSSSFTGSPVSFAGN